MKELSALLQIEVSSPRGKADFEDDTQVTGNTKSEIIAKAQSWFVKQSNEWKDNAKEINRLTFTITINE